MGLRRAHLVGSIPAASAPEAMRLAVQRLGPDLGYLPDGETGVRRNWVIGMIDVLFQIEVPVESVVLARAPSGLRPALAALLARRITALAQGAPAGSQFGAPPVPRGHEPPRPGAAPGCLSAGPAGERGGQPLARRRPLRYVHAPLAAAGQGRPHDPPLIWA